MNSASAERVASAERARAAGGAECLNGFVFPIAEAPTYLTSEATTRAVTGETFGGAPLPAPRVRPRCGLRVEDPRHGEAITIAGC